MSNSMVRRVGIIGLGKMGQPMGRHLQKAGFDVTAYDIDAVSYTHLTLPTNREV